MTDPTAAQHNEHSGAEHSEGAANDLGDNSASPAGEPLAARRKLLIGAMALAIAVLILVLVLAVWPDGKDQSHDAGANTTGLPTSSVQPTSSAQPTSSPTTAVDFTPLKKGEVAVDCTAEPEPKPGATITLTYTITAKKAGTVGIGAGVYDEDKQDHGDDDTGDVGSFAVQPGDQQFTRTLALPDRANLPTGKYDVAAELWPTGRVGEDGVENIAEDSCAPMTVR